MKVFYQYYNLHPLDKLNAVDRIGLKQGLYLKVEKDGVFLGDYFPHVNLGDLSCEDVLLNTSDDYFQNAISLALKVDQDIKYKPFKNHSFNTFVKSGLSKIKLKNLEDLEKVKEAIELGTTVRLDANGSFNIEQLNDFFKSVDKSKIDYIEDPSHEDNWNDLIVDTASDFITNPHAMYKIIKPNRKMVEDMNAIYSSYMGSDWGRVLCTNFLNLYGNFDLVHGIKTPNIYEEQKDIFNEDNTLNKKLITQIKQEILDGEWHELKS